MAAMQAYFAAKQGPCTMVSNLGQPAAQLPWQLDQRDYAQSFRTGPNLGGYTLDSSRTGT